jgi:hypothetical protein
MTFLVKRLFVLTAGLQSDSRKNQGRSIDGKKAAVKMKAALSLKDTRMSLRDIPIVSF